MRGSLSRGSGSRGAAAGGGAPVPRRAPRAAAAAPRPAEPAPAAAADAQQADPATGRRALLRAGLLAAAAAAAPLAPPLAAPRPAAAAVTLRIQSKAKLKPVSTKAGYLLSVPDSYSVAYDRSDGKEAGTQVWRRGWRQRRGDPRGATPPPGSRACTRPGRAPRPQSPWPPPACVHRQWFGGNFKTFEVSIRRRAPRAPRAGRARGGERK
jgi:hypothetical protein